MKKLNDTTKTKSVTNNKEVTMKKTKTEPKGIFETLRNEIVTFMKNRKEVRVKDLLTLTTIIKFKRPQKKYNYIKNCLVSQKGFKFNNVGGKLFLVKI